MASAHPEEFLILPPSDAGEAVFFSIKVWYIGGSILNRVKYYKLGICCFSTESAELMRKSKICLPENCCYVGLQNINSAKCVVLAQNQTSSSLPK